MTEQKEQFRQYNLYITCANGVKARAVMNGDVNKWVECHLTHIEDSSGKPLLGSCIKFKDTLGNMRYFRASQIVSFTVSALASV